MCVRPTRGGSRRAHPHRDCCSTARPKPSLRRVRPEKNPMLPLPRLIHADPRKPADRRPAGPRDLRTVPPIWRRKICACE